MSTSKPEKALYEAIKEAFPDAVHDYLVPDARLAGKHLIRVDCFIPSLNLVVEYDGFYWHKKRLRADTRKAKVLVKAGYSVLRVREKVGDEELPAVPLSSTAFTQIPWAGADFKELVEEIVASQRAIL